MVCVYCLTKIIDWLDKRRKEKYSDAQAEFISDLYKLQQKFSKRGEFGFSNSLGIQIAAWTAPKETKSKAITKQGKEIEELLGKDV